jgi:HSP20 family protein
MPLVRFKPGSDPVNGLLALQSELERFLRNPGFNLGLSGYGAYPPLNIFDDGDGIVVIAEVPGLDPASIQVTSQGRTLTISGERRRENIDGQASFHRRERAVGQFSRSIQIPEHVDLQKTSASYEAGLLKLRIPRSEASKPRQISVESVERR